MLVRMSFCDVVVVVVVVLQEEAFLVS